MRCVVLIVAMVALLGAVGCSSKPGGGDGGGGSGGPADLSAGGAPDLTPRSTAGIACGATACTTTLEFCCSGDNGVTGDCETQQNNMCSKSVFGCDGHEDCEPANPECCVSGGIAACRPAGYCASQVNARIMCHVTADCPPPTLCHNAVGSPYALCF